MKAFASVLPERPGQAKQRVPRKGFRMAVWEKYGLISPRFIGVRTGDPRFALLPRETRFRMALEERGGLLAVFGQYLTGRADLLPSPHLRQLSKISLKREAGSRPLLERELGGRVSEVRLVRAEPGWDVYAANFQGRPVIVEVHDHRGSDSENDKALHMLSREIRVLRDGVEGRISRPIVLDHFREWLHLQSDIERKRTILINLEQSPSSSICRYPRMIGELQSPSCLVYEAMEGTPIAVETSQPPESSKKSLQLVVEGLLDQSLFLSLIDAETHLENYIALPDGHLGFSSVPSLAPVPVEWNYEMLQYMACTVAGNSPRALHMLSRISSNTDPYAGEQHLMRELSGLQPELKINVVTPESVIALENYWRALANTRMIAPLFLELFHRQWTLVGQYNGDVAPESDLISESLWPVVSRILRLRFSDMVTLEKGQEWLSSSGLLLLGAARQVGMTLEQVRDNDMAMIVDRQEYERRDARLNRRTASLVRSGIALAVFLLALQLMLNSRGGILQLAAGLTAAAAAIALFIFVAKID